MQMKISAEVLEELTKDFTSPEEMESLCAQMLQHMINRGLSTELDGFCFVEHQGSLPALKSFGVRPH
jgi:hypothetical protein